jgi:hypothetical protein
MYTEFICKGCDEIFPVESYSQLILTRRKLEEGELPSGSCDDCYLAHKLEMAEAEEKKRADYIKCFQCGKINDSYYFIKAFTKLNVKTEHPFHEGFCNSCGGF